MMTAESIHLVVPCFRESGRIGGFLPELCQAMQAMGGVRVLVVEDGSDADEEQCMNGIVEDLRAKYDCLLPLKVLPENLGKGGAVYAGWAEHGGADWLAFVDADGSCSASEVARLLKMTNGNTAIFASRVKMLGRRVERLFKRHLLGRIYATLVSEILHIPVYDSQCGLKMVPRRAYAQISNRLRVHGFAFDVELMVALLDTGCQIKEVPIDWHETPGGKVRLLRDSWLMALDILKIRAGRTSGKLPA
jgi:glycosyltransferase involved in cell wall biosynthesis